MSSTSFTAISASAHADDTHSHGGFAHSRRLLWPSTPHALDFI